MTRILIPPDALAGGASITLVDPAILHHLQRVLRVRTGDPLDCFDGAGRSYRGTVSRVSSREIVVAVAQHRDEPAPARELVLAQALIRPERFEWVLEKATELGVGRIVPLLTARTTVRSTTSAARAQRWRRIIEGACAQCGRNRVPTLETPQRFETLLARLPGAVALIPTLEGGTIPLAEAVRKTTAGAAVWLLIGPEGDFTADEVARAVRQGATAVRLGPRTLRSETAALAALTLVQHLLGAL